MRYIAGRKRMMKIKQKNGFTIIELLFVIAILSTIVLLGMRSYRNKENDLLAQKVAVQMLQIMQMAKIYYVNTSNTWPTEITKIPGYENGIKDPWNNNYYGCPREPANFRVCAINLPIDVKERIAALLPNSDETTNACSSSGAALCFEDTKLVKLYYENPESKKSYFIAKIGSTDDCSGLTCSFDGCPLNTTPMMSVDFSRIEAQTKNGANVMASIELTDSFTDPKTTCSAKACTFNYSQETTDNKSASGVSIKLNYAIYCVPAS
jgi:prepilin-type N-terminal cleavage/methylation domain-containing protein